MMTPGAVHDGNSPNAFAMTSFGAAVHDTAVVTDIASAARS